MTGSSRVGGDEIPSNHDCLLTWPATGRAQAACTRPTGCAPSVLLPRVAHMGDPRGLSTVPISSAERGPRRL